MEGNYYFFVLNNSIKTIIFCIFLIAFVYACSVWCPFILGYLLGGQEMVFGRGGNGVGVDGRFACWKAI